MNRPKSIRDFNTIQRNEQSLENLDNGLTAIIAGADVALNRASDTAGQCSVAWLAAWARDGAMLGKMGQRQAEYERKWRAAGIAIAYLKLKSFASVADSAVIEPWLKALAEKVSRSDDSTNSHRYWVGLVETAVGVATNDAGWFAKGRNAFDRAMGDIAADGSLKQEMARERRALHYHNFALAPLVLMAELAAFKGEDWYAHGSGAIHRLASLTLEGLNNPAAFSARAGVWVEIPRDGIVGWVAFYAKRFPQSQPEAGRGISYNYYWLGGDMQATMKVWGAKAS